MHYYRTDHAHDPNETLWQRYHEAAVASGLAGPDARKAADKALAEHIERWPRDRKVIPLTEANSNMEGAVAQLVVSVRDTLENRLMFAIDRADSAKRHREAETLKSLDDAVRGLCVRSDEGIMVPSMTTIQSWCRMGDQGDAEIEGQAIYLVEQLIDLLEDVNKGGALPKSEHVEHAVARAKQAIARGKQ